MSNKTEVFDRSFRLAICGSANTGKKTLLRSFSTDGDENNLYTTLNVEEEKILVKAEVSRVWTKDMNGRFDAAAVIFSTDDLFSFEYALEILAEIMRFDAIPVVFIENKIDIIEKSEIDKSQVETEMRNKHKRLYRVSALKEFNVMHPFAYLLEKLTRPKMDVNANERKCSKTSGNNSMHSPINVAWTKSANQSTESTSTATSLNRVNNKKEKCVLM